MKILFFFLAITVCYLEPTSAIAQNSTEEGRSITLTPEMKSDLDEIGLYIANRMKSCCSSFGGNNVYGRVTYDDVRKNSFDGTFSIPMTVGWYGSLTGTHYWIKGILKIDSEGNKRWLKISDSGGPFKEANCGTNCSL